MPNEFDTNKNQLDLFSYSESKQNQQDKRQNLASSGFTATVWTLSGVVLAACSLFEDDEGLGGGSVSVNASPVRDARLYFDIDGDGDVDAEDVRLQNEQYPNGFTTGPDGRATGIPIELLNRPYIADLNGATDAATEHPLEGQYSSLQDEDGNHLIASPITDLINERATGGTSVNDVVEELLTQGGNTPTATEVDALLAELRTTTSYFPGGSERVIALSKYLADNKAREVVGREDTAAEKIAESQRIIEAVETGLAPASTDAIVILNVDTDTNTAGVQLAPITIGEHDSYVGIINAFAQDGSALSYRLTNQDGTAYNGPYAIDDRGGIRVADDTVTPTNVDGDFRVVVSDGNPSNDQIVEVTIMVDDTVYELSLEEGREVGDIEENVIGASSVDPLITGIEVDDATVNMPDYFTIRDNALGIFADKFEMEFDSANQAWNLQLKTGEWLDYEAIPDGEFELYVSVRNDATADMGEHSNILTVTITVNDDPNDISFEGGIDNFRARLVEDFDVEASGQVEIRNQGGAQVVLNSETPQSTGVQTLTLTYGTFTYDHETNEWTYTLNNSAANVQALLSGDTRTEVVKLTIDDPSGSVITYERSIVLNVFGANENVRFEDSNGALTSIANVPDTMNIEIGDETALNGSFALGNVFNDFGVTLEGRLSESETTTVAFAETTDAEVLALQTLFTLTPGGDLAFAGTNADAVALGTGIQSLELLVSTPLSTTLDIPLTVQVNIVNLIDNDGAGSAIYEIDGDTGQVGNTLRAQIATGGEDVDGVMAGSERYQWYRGDDAANGVLVGSGSTYTVQTDDVDETITLIVTYTDGSGTPETSEAATTPVRITRPTAAELEFAENQAGETLTLTATSSDDDGSVDVNSYMFVYTDQNGQEQVAATHQGFSINNQGVITLTGNTPLDYETASSYDLRIRATDANNEVGHLSITIRVGDVNDNDPVFEQATYTTAIDETLAPGASVISVRATDDDGTTANSDVRYSIISGNTGNVFEINERTGAITVAAGADLDFETTPSYTLMIGASDGLNASGTADQTFTADDTATVTININDINDITPTYMVTAGENSASVRGTEAGGNSADVGTGYRITITDADTTNTFRGNFDVSDRRFDFVETSAGSGVWELTLLANEAVALSEASLTLTYQVYDGTNTAAGGRGSVTVAVVDSTVTYTATQNAPLEIAEADNIDTTTLGTGGVLAQVTAESSENQTVTYTLTSAVDQNGADVSSLFVVDSDDGEVRFTDSTMDLDYEDVSEYSLVITASARQSATTMDTDDVPTTVIIRVINEQEGDGTYIIQGNVAAGAELMAVVNDPDGTRSVTYEWYSLDSSGGDRQVIAATQSIRLPGAADFDDTRTYHVTITHTDNLGHTPGPMTLDASAVVFDIQNTTGNAFPSSIAENTDSLPVVVASLDGDTRTATYTFVGGDTITTSGVFTISQSGSTAGAITVNAPSDINFETAQEFNDGSRGYTLNVRATFAEDTANNLPEVTGDVVVTIIVTDVNEHKPVFATDPALSTGTDEIAEDAANGARVGLFRATDADGSNNDVTYSLDDGGLGIFDIRAVDGTNNWEIYVANRTNLDFESATKSYTIEITASDGAEPAMTTTEAFTINITDVNDNAPTATPSAPTVNVPGAISTATATVTEEAAGAVGGTATGFYITLDDLDKGANVNEHDITVTGTHASRFGFVEDGTTANQWNLVLLEGQTVDREDSTYATIGMNRQGMLSVDYTISDGANTPITDTVGVAITDINEHKPVLGEPARVDTRGMPTDWARTYETDGVPEGAVPSQGIFTATATDRDENNQFSYEIVSVDSVTYDSSTSIFAIHAASGRVGITSALDYETASEIMDDTNTVIGRGHEIDIVAIDHNGNGLRSEPRTYTVLVANADDGAAKYEITGTVVANGTLTAQLVDGLAANEDPDGVVANSLSFQWFTENVDGTGRADIATNGDQSTYTLPSSLTAGKVYGVRIEYTDNAGTKYELDDSDPQNIVDTSIVILATALRFSQSTYNVNIEENDATPMALLPANLGLEATLNTDPSATVTYTFLAGGVGGTAMATDQGFTIATDGTITLDSAFNFEALAEAARTIRLTVQATSGTDTAIATVVVNVQDANDNDPTLSEPYETGSDPRTTLAADSINENATGAAATSIYFEASDADTVFSGAGQTALGFTITATAGTTDAQDIADMFEMAYDSSEDIYTLRLKDGMALNAEAAGLTTNSGVQQIELRIQATDGRTDMPTATPTAGQGLSDARTVTITVNDINEFGPVFKAGATDTTDPITENLGAGTVVIDPNPATDGDATVANRDLEYSIVRVTSGGVVTGADFFTLDKSTGGITLAKAFDYDTTGLISTGSTVRGYVIELLVVDKGNSMQATQMLTVVVTDEDDVALDFGAFTWETASTATTTDPAEADTKRTVNEDVTGLLATIALTDPDTPEADWQLSIQSGNGQGTGGNDVFTFTRNGRNGELRIADGMDFDGLAGSYDLVLQVSDGTNTPANTHSITITVVNVNDETPTFTNDPIVTWVDGFKFGIIPETTVVPVGGRVLVGRVAISDDDGATAFLDDRVFSIAGAGTKFEIERNTDTATNGGTLGEGLIYLNAALDREGLTPDDAEYDAVKITVKDGSLPAVTSDAFSIFIDDINEADPVVTMTPTTKTIGEQTAPAGGTEIATFTVTDADATTYDTVGIDVVLSGDPDDRFEITGWNAAAGTGTIRLKAGETLDFEDDDDKSITLTVTADDPLGAVAGTNITGEGMATVTITVGDENDNDPEYITGMTTGDPKVIWETDFPGGNILENTAIGTTLGKIQVRDADMDELMFEVVATPDGINTIDSKFEVVYEESTGLGLLKLKTALDLDDPDNPDPSTIALQVIISDEDNDPNPIKNAELSDTGNLILVTIQPVNEHKPALNFSGSTTVNIDEQMPPSNGNGVNTGISFTVDDADSKSYRIDDFDVSGDSRFRVEWSRANQEGSIWLKAGATLDYEKTDPMDPTVFPDRSITLTLTVTDANPVRHSGTDTQTLTINVDPTDDEDPVFNDTHITWNVGALNIRGVPDNTNPTAIAVFERVTVDGTTTGAPAGRKLATLMAADPDTSGALTYGIDNGPQIGGVDIFEIGGANNDELLLKTPLDYEHASVGDIEDDMGNVIARGYTLTLTVSDGRMGVNPVSHKVTIRVLNADEGKAVFAPLTSSGDVTAPAVGDELTFNPTPTTADPDGNPVAPNTFTRTWYRENPDGTGFDTITNASDTYTITSADVGKIVGVIVNYIDGGGTEYLGTAGVKVELANVVVSDFEVTGGTSGMANQYDASAVDATGTLMFGTASAAKVNTAGTYTIVTDGTYGTAEVVDGVWTYNVDNTDAAVKALASGVELEDTFTIGVPLTAAAGGGVQNVDVTVTITGQTASQALGTSGRDTLDRSSATGFEVIQGSDLIDTITVGDHGSLVIGGHGDDEITLGDGVDTVVHRFDSLTDAAWQNDDGQTTIIDFERGKDKLILVDVSNNPVDLATFLDESVSGGITGTNAATDGGMQIKLELNGANITGVIIEIFSTVPEDGPGGTGNNSGTAITVRFKGDGYNISTNMQNRADLLGVGDPDVPAGSPNGFYDSTARWFTDFKTLPLFFDPDGSFDTSNEHFDVIALADLMIDIA